MLHTYAPFAQEEPHNLRPFSFRSETPADAVQFLALVAQKAVTSQMTDQRLFFTELFIETCPQTHECLVEFQSNMSLEDLQAILRPDFDQRVMLQTLRQLPAHQNTMSRNFDL